LGQKIEAVEGIVPVRLSLVGRCAAIGQIVPSGVRARTATPTASLAEIAKTLEHHRIKRVPVVRDGKLVGIVTRSNLLQALAAADVSKPASLDDRTIRERLLKELNAQPWAHMLTKNIVVQDGVVHLWGLVQTKEERHALRVAAENTPGAKSVEDHLRQYRVPVAGE
jgi:CBS domain-containing protein